MVTDLRATKTTSYLPYGITRRAAERVPF